MLRLLAKEYVRVKSGQLKHDVITDAFLNLEFNLSQRDAQKDLFSFLNIKHFTKQALLLGPYPAVPTDLFTVPDTMIDMKCSTGTPATVTTTESGSNNHLTATMIEPGTAFNSWGFVPDVASSTHPVGSIVVDFVLKTVTYYLTSGVTTALQVVSFFAASRAACSLMVVTLKAGENGSGTITPALGYSFTGGLGSGFYPAREISPEDYNRISAISLLAPSDQEPAYMLIGNTSGSKQIQMIPNTIMTSLLMYKAVVVDMAADTDSLSIPPEYEIMVLTDVLRKIFELLAKKAEEQDKKQEYESERKSYFDQYQAALQTKGIEKKRMKASDEER